MTSKIVKFQLHRSGVVLAVAGLVLFSLLVFAAGFIAGSARRLPAAPAPAVPRPAAAKPALPPLPPPAATAAAAVPKPAPAPPESRAFTLRVAAFATEEEARARVQELADRNLEATVIASPTGGSAVLYSVCIGRYEDRAKAAEAADALLKTQSLDAAVIPAPTS